MKSSGAGFVLGYAETSGGATITYGSSVLSFGTDYRAVVAYHDIAGALNDTASIYVNPTDLFVEGNNTAYVDKSWNSATAENESVAAVNLRQGTASSAATLFVDNLGLSQTFSDVSAVPEPVTWALIVFGTLFGAVQLGRLYRRQFAAR